ncbi:glycolate oxidase subunit GlcE [Neisseria weaveri]|uniref:glycolate oxidase subunit GlcE n=1 Tax=Neisseria weaveri TaxID=28091 RepID=UPI0007C9A877|nr:glycolate oxidase subunit GlcE [Neisseria weaveri]SAY51308.1 Oxidoreductase, putative [Neisseria weaveri]
MEAGLLRFQEQIHHAAAYGLPLSVRGGGTKDFYGEPFGTEQADVLDTRGYAGIVAYDADELVLTAKAGTPLAEIEATLAERRQMLPFEPPHFGEGATLGGAVAAGLAGPRRAHAGAVKDFVIGVQLLDGQGRLLNFGGRVVKNVAGFDVHKLMAGSLGTLGLMTEISVSLRPQAAAEATLQFECSAAEARRMLNGWMGKPLPLTGSFWANGALFVRLGGSAAGVRAAVAQLGGAVLSEPSASGVWTAVREQWLPVFRPAEGKRLWRVSVPDTAPELALDGSYCMEWGGGLRWYQTDEPAKVVRTAALNAGGHATLFRGGLGDGETVFTPVSPAVAAVQQRLKQTFDPQGIFNPNRRYFQTA